MLAYLIDENLWRHENEVLGNNYSDAYIRQLCDQMGATSHALSPEQLADPQTLAQVRTLIIGQRSGRDIPAMLREKLEAWVRAGGTLIGLAVRGMDNLFGIRVAGRNAQWPDDASVTGYWHPVNHRLTLQVLPLHFDKTKLPIISDTELVALDGASEVARLFDSAKRDLEMPAITWRRCDKGHAGYFAFDPAKTVWMLHQGRPLGSHLQISTRMSLIGDNQPQVPYADTIVQVLANMIALQGHAMIHTVPPMDGQAADALFYWGGDEYLGPADISVRASDYMKSLGLPYHINIRIQDHPMTRAEFDHIRANGHEVSLYLNTIKGRPDQFSPEYFREQVAHLQERFGVEAGSCVMMNLRWQGGTELPRWMAEAGISADNSMRGYDSRPMAPLHNGPAWGFAFGTAFPFFPYDDAAHRNRRIDLVEQVVSWYEVGHRGSPPPYGDRTTRMLDDLHVPIDTAAKYHWAVNLFYHPGYIANSPACRDAIAHVLDYIKDRGYRVIHMGNNQAADWWRDRSRCTATLIRTDMGSRSYHVTCHHAGGLSLRIPVEDRQITHASVDGHHCEHHVRDEFGQRWCYVTVPDGSHQVDIALGAPRIELLDQVVAPNGWSSAGQTRRP